MAERILMIDDDDRLAGMVSDYLGGAGFRLTTAGTAREGEALLKRESFDAVILDLMLPDADGLDLCRRLRGVTDVPILMLTARGPRAVARGADGPDEGREARGLRPLGRRAREQPARRDRGRPEEAPPPRDGARHGVCIREGPGPMSSCGPRASCALMILSAQD